MSDMGDILNEMKYATKEHRANMLKAADTTGWTRHTDYHFSRVFDGERMEWWPSGGKAKYKDIMIYGHAKVNALISKLLKKG